MKESDKLKLFFQDVIALVTERIKSRPPFEPVPPPDPQRPGSVVHTLRAPHAPKAECWQGSCECNNDGHWYSLYELVERFWQNAPEVDADWEERAKVHRWNSDTLHELLVAAFLGEKAEPEKSGRTLTWMGKPITNLTPEMRRRLNDLHQAGVVTTEEMRAAIAPHLPPINNPIPTFNPLPISKGLAVILPDGAENS